MALHATTQDNLDSITDLPAEQLLGLLGFCIAAAVGLLAIVFAIGYAIDVLINKIEARRR